MSGITINGVSGLTDSDIPDTITASNYLPLSGGTISGDLTIIGNATLGAITLQNATAGYFTATSTTQASTFPYASTTALTISGSAYIGSLNGALQANGGLVSATTSVVHQYGGTGLTATPSFGQILRGTGSGYSLVATSTLGISTTDITEGSNLFWTNARFDTRLSATTTLPNITTLANLATVGTITSGVWSGTTIAVNKGGTGQTSFGQGWLNSDGTTLSASTSPTVAYLTATSTTATSTFPLLKATTAFQLGADYLTDITGTGLQITNSALTLNATGDWTGTFDGQDGTYYLSRANHTGTQGVSTLSNYDWTFANNYGVNNITGSTTMPLWAQGGLNASSTSHFVYASTTALTASGNSYLGTVSSGTWNGSSIGDAYIDDTITLTNLTQITNRAISDTTGTLTVARGGTGQTSFGQGWLNSDGTTLSASTSPTVAYLTATSTTATSTFAGGMNVAGSSGLTVFQNGFVGIGTTTPLRPLVVEGVSGAVRTGFGIDTDDTIYGPTLYGYNTTDAFERLFFRGTLIAASDQNITFGTGSFSNIVWNTTGNDFLNIRTNSNGATFSGNIVINDKGTAPTAAYPLVGNPTLRIQASSTVISNYIQLYHDKTNGNIETGIGHLILTPASNVGIGTTSPNWKLSVAGIGSFDDFVRASYFKATSTTASTFPYASTTALTVSGNSYLGTVSSGLWNSTAIATQYGGTGQNFSASSGLVNLYSGTASAMATSSLGLLTTDVAEGNNLYWTNTRFDNRLSATTSLQNITTLANLATVGTITSGTWSGTTIAVNKGGTGQTSFGQGWLNSDGTTISASTSPTVAYLTATSTTATSTLTDLNFPINSNIFYGGQRFLTASTTTAGNLTIGYQSASKIDANGGSKNTGVGYQALGNATSTGSNTALGYQALKGSATISSSGENTAIGYRSLSLLTSGSQNTAIGMDAGGQGVLTGTDNVFVGKYSGIYTSSASYNVVVGSLAGYTDNNQPLTTGTDNILIGYNSGVLASSDVNSIAIGSGIRGLGSNTIVLGASSHTKTILNGNVGIGTTTPNNILDIYSTTKSAIGFSGASGSTYKWTIGQDISNGGRFSIASSTALGTLDRFVIDGKGNIGVGITPVEKFSVLVDSESTVGGVNIAETSDGTPGSKGYMLNIDINDVANYPALRVNNLNSGVKFVVLNDGDTGVGTSSPWRKLGVTGTVGFDGLTTATGSGSLCLTSTTNKEVVYNAADTCLPSLRSTKHDINNLDLSGLDIIKNLQPVSFVYNKEYGDDRARYGFIAEDTAAVNPHLASYNGAVLSGIDDRAILSVAVKAIQEMNLKVVDLQASVAVSSGTGSDGLFSWIVGKFMAMFGISFGENKIRVDNFEMKDSATGETYCVKISNGDWSKIKGVCGSSSSSTVSSMSSSSSVVSSSSSSLSSSAESSSSSSVVSSSSADSSSSSSSSTEASSSSAESSSSSSEASSSSSSEASSSSVSSESSSSFSSVGI